MIRITAERDKKNSITHNCKSIGVYIETSRLR